MTAGHTISGPAPHRPPREIRWLDVDGPIRVLDHGPIEQPVTTVLCVHGLGGSASNWNALAPRLPASSRVLAVDLPAHGGSRARPGPALDDAVRVLHAVRGTAEGPVVLLAHSIGATIALRYAADPAARLDQLVLVAPPVPRAPRFDLGIAAKRRFLRLPGVASAVARKTAGLSPEALVAAQLQQATPHADRVPRAVVDAAVDEVRRKRADGVAAAAQDQQWRMILETMRLLARGGSYGRTLRDIGTPTAWIHGTEDPMSRLRSARRLAALRPDWPFLEVEGAGHLPHLEQPERVATLLGPVLAPG